MLHFLFRAVFATLHALIRAMSPPDTASCSGTEMTKSQGLDPDFSLPVRRDPHGRFSSGSSGNPKGRPLRIANPKRRRLDLRARPTSGAVLLRLVERKPYLLRRLAAQLLRPRAALLANRKALC
jgi:hypothetical protein